MSDAILRKVLLLALPAIGAAVLVLSLDFGPSAEPEQPAPNAETDLPKPRGEAKATAGKGLSEQRRVDADVDALEELVALARHDRKAFDQRIRDALRGELESPKLAAYQALLQIDREQGRNALIEVLTEGSPGARLRELAVQVVTPLAEHRRDARAALLGLLANGEGDTNERSAAFGAVLRYGEADEVQACLPQLHKETTPDVVAHAARELAASRNATSRREAAALHWRHPDPAVRKRLRTLRIGK